MKRMRRREFVMFDHEADDLREKAQKACMSESQLIRLLIAGYQPPPAPDEQFHQEMERLLAACDALTTAARKLRRSEGRDDVQDEVSELRELRRILLRKYLSGERTDALWQ